MKTAETCQTLKEGEREREKENIREGWQVQGTLYTFMEFITGKSPCIINGWFRTNLKIKK